MTLLHLPGIGGRCRGSVTTQLTQYAATPRDVLPTKGYKNSINSAVLINSVFIWRDKQKVPRGGQFRLISAILRVAERERERERERKSGRAGPSALATRWQLIFPARGCSPFVASLSAAIFFCSSFFFRFLENWFLLTIYSKEGLTVTPHLHLFELNFI